MKTAVVGHGMMGERHVNVLKALGYQVDSVVGRDLGRVKEFARKRGIPFATTRIEDLADRGVAVVHVCTPPESHFEAVGKALGLGMSVLCEKPFVIDPAQGEELAELAAGRVAGVAFNNRFHIALEHARQRIADGEIGTPLLVHGSYLQEFHALPSLFSWRYRPEEGGPMLATSEIGSHWIDALRYVTGLEVEAVQASLGGFPRERKLDGCKMYPLDHQGGKTMAIDLDTVAIVKFKMRGGGLASAVFSEITQGRPDFMEINVTGNAGALWWNSERFTDLVVGKKFRPRMVEVNGYAADATMATAKMIAEFHRDAESGARSPGSHCATFEDGVANARICQAIYRSAKNNSSWEEIPK